MASDIKFPYYKKCQKEPKLVYASKSSQLGKFHVKCHKFILDMKFPHFYKLTYRRSIGEISCRMPEALSKTLNFPTSKNEYIVVKLGKFHVKCQKLILDMKLPH